MVRILRVLRWTLFFEGWVLLAAPAMIERWIYLLDLMWGGGRGFVSAYVTSLSIVSWLAGALSLATFWGLGKQMRWVRWTGLAVSFFNLFIFPPLGLTGLVTMRRFARYHLAEDSDRDTLSEETPLVRVARISLVLLMLVIGYRWLDQFADTAGVASFGFGWQTIVLILAGQVVVALVHDLGHTLAAVALGFHFPVFRVGPWAWARGAGGEVHLQGNVNRLFAHDSYLSGAPGSAAHISWDLIAAAAAGPMLSLLISFALFLGMLRSPGTAFANEGRLMGVLALLFALDFSINMLPFGFSDGRVLVDLLSNNRRGRNMVHQMSAGGSSAAASGAPMRSGFAAAVADPVAICREELQLLTRRGVLAGLQLARAHQNLGAVELMAGNLVSAREHLEQSLELFAAFPDPRHSAASWTWLEKLHRRNQAGVESHNAYGRAVHGWIAAKERAKKMEEFLEAHVSLAALHMGQGELGACVEDLEQADSYLKAETGMHMLRARHQAIWAVCGFRLRWQDRSRTSAFEAQRLFTHKKLDARARGYGLLSIGDMARDLWEAGQGALAAELLSEAIEGLVAAGSEHAMAYFRLLRAEVLAKTGEREAALAELDAIQPSPGCEDERKGMEVMGWANFHAGRFEEAARCFAGAGQTYDERERARMHVAEARAMIAMGRAESAYGLAKAACDVLMIEEHGEAGIALMLLALRLYGEAGGSSNHPYFEEGRRIVRAARFQPPPEKYLAFEDLSRLYEALGRPIEAAQLREESGHVRNQMTWQPHFVAVDPESSFESSGEREL